MPRVKQGDRKRAKRPKTRTGCKTCKIRRVKCDETKPSCSRCTSTGRKCDGYEVDIGSEMVSFALAHSVPSIIHSARERRAFAFFQDRTVVQLSGLHDCDLWDRTILQAAHVDIGIRCAVVALASLHEGFEKRGDAVTIVDDFALKQYNLAIRQHLDEVANFDKDRGKVDSYVASSVIFMCIELIQGHYMSALSLIKGAVKLFYQFNANGRSNSGWPLEILESLLSRFQSQALGLVGPGIVGTTVPPQVRAATSFRMPKKFASVSEAKDCLEFYSDCHALSRYAEGSPGLNRSPEDERGRFSFYIELLSNWSSAFNAMLASADSNVSDRDRRAVAVLKIWRIMMDTGINMALNHPWPHSHMPEDQVLWDNYQLQFEELLALAESVVKPLDGVQESKGLPLHRFTLDSGIVGPLYDTARICRDPVIRRKCISLLREYPCREGLWDSLLAARTAERQMELEESALPEVKTAADVPGWARIASVTPTFQFGERWASLVFTRQQDPSSDCQPESFHDIIEW